MARSHVPAEVKIGTRTFKTDALPDPFDDLDLIYRPRLQVLPSNLDHRAGVSRSSTRSATPARATRSPALDRHRARRVRGQDASARRPATTTPTVSPYMLYALARRYDEFPGTADVGSSLRGAFKGWHRHGVCRRRPGGRAARAAT